jgi:hypothetical protein
MDSTMDSIGELVQGSLDALPGIKTDPAAGQ